MHVEDSESITGREFLQATPIPKVLRLVCLHLLQHV